MLILAAVELIKPTNLPQPTADQALLNHALAVFLTTLGSIALLIVVISGLQYVTSEGNPDKTAEAKRRIIYTLVALVIAALAGTIVNVVISRIDVG